MKKFRFRQAKEQQKIKIIKTNAQTKCIHKISLNLDIEYDEYIKENAGKHVIHTHTSIEVGVR